MCFTYVVMHFVSLFFHQTFFFVSISQIKRRVILLLYLIDLNISFRQEVHDSYNKKFFFFIMEMFNDVCLICVVERQVQFGFLPNFWDVCIPLLFYTIYQTFKQFVWWSSSNSHGTFTTCDWHYNGKYAIKSCINSTSSYFLLGIEEFLFRFFFSYPLIFLNCIKFQLVFENSKIRHNFNVHRCLKYY